MSQLDVVVRDEPVRREVPEHRHGHSRDLRAVQRRGRPDDRCEQRVREAEHDQIDAQPHQVEHEELRHRARVDDEADTADDGELHDALGFFAMGRRDAAAHALADMKRRVKVGDLCPERFPLNGWRAHPASPLLSSATGEGPGVRAAAPIALNKPIIAPMWRWTLFTYRLSNKWCTDKWTHAPSRPSASQRYAPDGLSNVRIVSAKMAVHRPR